eukprot:7399980-Pyramimonas_sp.AAC.1
MLMFASHRVSQNNAIWLTGIDWKIVSTYEPKAMLTYSLTMQNALNLYLTYAPNLARSECVRQAALQLKAAMVR